MNIWLLGNGFDLAHNLPTGYISFLHTMEFLQKQDDLSKIKTIGDIFGNEELKDEAIKNSYKKYSINYNKVDFIAKPFENLKSNIWLQYFIKCFNRDAGWIDFEKEIGNVITAFKKLFNLEELLEYKGEFYLNKLKIELKQILSHFDFFYISSEFVSDDSASFSMIKRNYLIEKPFGSGNIVVDKEKIVDFLFESLSDFSNILSSYLFIFIERLLNKIDKDNYKKFLDLELAKYVITFNYTWTARTLYNQEKVYHVHGHDFNDKKIVLGVNADEDDIKDENTSNVDTLFLSFKKYYQRVRYNTDIEYLYAIKNIENDKKNGCRVVLTVVGHSLDETDEDIIKELFELADTIEIYYHEENKIGDYIRNLVKIYGREEFDKLRRDKLLNFNSDLISK